MRSVSTTMKDDVQQTYKRKHKGKKRNRELPLEFQIPNELGSDIVMFQLATKVTTRSNKFTSPFRAPIHCREPPPVVEALKLRKIIIDGATGQFDK